jgi:hypothetical protein
MIMRLREGAPPGAHTRGAIDSPRSGSNATGIAQLGVRSATVVPGQQGALIRINDLALSVGMPDGVNKDGSTRYRDTTIGTNIDIREGQKVIVGKANMVGAEEQALILVLTAKVVD